MNNKKSKTNRSTNQSTFKSIFPSLALDTESYKASSRSFKWISLYVWVFS